MGFLIRILVSALAAMLTAYLLKPAVKVDSFVTALILALVLALLNALVNTAGGASWVSLHHGGGVGMGYSIHAGMVIVADGSPDAEARLSRVLRNDPGMGVIRHADAGYELARQTAASHGLDLSRTLASE